MRQRIRSHYFPVFFFFFGCVREREERNRAFKLLYSIFGILPVGIRRAKSESSSTRRGLRMGTQKEGFHRRSEGGDLGKSKFLGLGKFLRPSLVLLRFKR